MHEVSLMQSTLNIALAQAKGANAAQIDFLTMEIGDLSGVMPETLEFAFEVLRLGTIAENAQLKINSVAVVCHCQSCNCDFQPEDLEIGVIVGDLATDNDARRLHNLGISTVQITTGNACHLQANMIRQAALKLNLDRLRLLIIENVGNLVCPAAYDLGEDLRIVLLSVTEGEDKPLKYPTMFKSAQIIIINKIDLAKAVEFNREQAIANILKIAPQTQIFEVSAKTGQGIKSLLKYLYSQLAKKYFV